MRNRTAAHVNSAPQSECSALQSSSPEIAYAIERARRLLACEREQLGEAPPAVFSAQTRATKLRLRQREAARTTSAVNPAAGEVITFARLTAQVEALIALGLLLVGDVERPAPAAPREALERPCPRCGAAARRPCLTPSGNRVPPHVDRKVRP